MRSKSTTVNQPDDSASLQKALDVPSRDVAVSSKGPDDMDTGDHVATSTLNSIEKDIQKKFMDIAGKSTWKI